MKIPIEHIRSYMTAHGNEPIPYEYAEILLGCLDDSHAILQLLREENAFLNDMLENAHNRSRRLEAGAST
jgi:hypothetical protein